MKKLQFFTYTLFYIFIYPQENVSNYVSKVSKTKFTNNIKSTEIDSSLKNQFFTGVPNFNVYYEFHNNIVLDTRSGEIYKSVIDGKFYPTTTNLLTSFWLDYIDIYYSNSEEKISKTIRFKWNDNLKKFEFEKDVKTQDKNQVFIKNIKLLGTKFKTNFLNAENEANSKIDYHHDLAVAEIDGKEILIDNQGKLLSNEKYTTIGRQYPLMTVLDQGLMGIIDNYGKNVFPIKYKDIGEIGGGWFKVKEFDRYKIVDIHRNTFLDGDFEKVGSFSEGILNVTKFQNNCYYYDINGRQINDVAFNKCSDFQEDRATITLNNKCGYIDTKGNLITNIPKFDNCSSFKNGISVITVNNNKGVINSKGNIIIEPIYTDIKFIISGNYCVVYDGIHYGVISISGNMIIPKDYSEIWEVYYPHISQESVFVVKTEDKYGVLDNKNNVLVPLEFSNYNNSTKTLYKKDSNNKLQSFAVADALK